MKRIHLVVLWHMHQPQYRDPENGRYVLPWTRLHALKDYWGMVEVLREFPNFHATFNVVPSLGMQLEEYASCSFKEPWFSLAFKNADELSHEDKAEIISRAFQVNQERLMSRWPRFFELFEWSRPAGGAQALVSFTPRDWRDLQLLSQLAWMDESWLETDEVVSGLSSHPSADLRFRYRARRQSRHTAPAPRLPPSGRCPRTITPGPRIPRKSFWREARRSLAL